MRVAVIADTHGNSVALDAVLADLAALPAAGIVCLGDMIEGGAQPAETMRRLRDLGCPIVMGNADAWMFGHIPTAATGPDAAKEEEIREWTMARLSAEDSEFMASFAPTVEIGLEGGKTLLCFHGSPASFDDFIFPTTPEEDFERLLGPYSRHILCGGHTHMQQIRRLGDTFFFNPGSVGFAFNRNQPDESFQADPWAEYAILSSEGDRVGLELRRVPYDREKWIGIILSSGRPYAEEAAAKYGRRASYSLSDKDLELMSLDQL